MPPGGVANDAVTHAVVTSDRVRPGDVDAADFAMRVVARLAPELTARPVRRKDAVAWSDQVPEGLRYLR